MVGISGFAYTQWGALGMLNTEAIVAIIAAVLFTIITIIVKNKKSIVEHIDPVWS